MFHVYKWQFCENELQLRTLEDHKLQCDLLEDPITYADYSKEYGINHRTSLMDLKYFNSYSSALVPDVMHNVLEGVLQHEVKLVLQHCVDSMKYFWLTQLTQIMETFEFGNMEVTNRPTPIQRKTLNSVDYSLQQNGM